MDIFQLNIRHLGAVATIARSGSISAAAKEVNLTQPAMTQGIARLEQQLDVALFDRRPDGVVLTEAGELLVPRAEAALRLIGSNKVTSAQMRAFVALARAGSYTAASVQTGLSEPSLHRAVGDLAIVMGHRLVDRRGRSVVMTTRGQALARRMMLAQSELRAALSELSDLLGREVGRIVIGAMPLSRAQLLPDAMAAFHEAHPHAGIAILEGSHHELIGFLRDGEIDIMVGALRDATIGSDVDQIPLFADKPVVIGRVGHPLTEQGGGVGIADLARFNWILPPEGTPLRQLWSRMFEQGEVTPPSVPMECGSVVVVRQILRKGDFLTLLSRDQVAVELDAGILAAICPAPLDVMRTIGITTRSDWRPTRLQKAFVQSLHDAAIPLQQQYD